MTETQFSTNDLQLILKKLQDDWGENFRDYTILSQWAEVISVDHENLQRVIRNHLYLAPDSDGFDFARTIPTCFVTEECLWTLTWPDAEAFNDPSGFEESDYDSENVNIGSADWDDPDLPSEVFNSAIDDVDWWATGEWLDDLDADSTPNFDDAPQRLRPYLQNALALFRRQKLGRWGYLHYLATHPKFLWQRISKHRLWRSITSEQLGSFSFKKGW